MKKSFGISREKFVKAVIIGDTTADPVNPGPGAYNR